MSNDRLRLFASDDAVRRIGQGLLDHTLPRGEWTHEAHLAACLWLLVERPDIVAERDLPMIIRAYNLACGGVNDDTQGYHETLTQLYIGGVRAFLAAHAQEGLGEAVNALLASAMAQRDWPLQFYSRERLFSIDARRAWAEPDIAPFLL